MKRNMYKWLEDIRLSSTKKALPILSFPAVSLMGISVSELISDSTLQAQAMKLVADRTDSAASVSLMDLSVEAECFGAHTHFSDDEVPTILGALITDEEEAVARVLEMVHRGTVAARTGKTISIQADSVCLHGDGEKAVKFAEKIRNALLTSGVKVVSLSQNVG